MHYRKAPHSRRPRRCLLLTRSPSRAGARCGRQLHYYRQERRLYSDRREAPRLNAPGGRSVTECQGCGAWNDTSRTFCVLCGTPLAEIDEWDATAELPPLPPLPDGGLSASMPSWLRGPPVPIIAEAPPLAPVDRDVPPQPVADLAPLGPRADPRTFL